MPNFYGAPEISIHEVDRKLKTGEKFILLDVREPEELKKVRIDHPNLHLSPFSQITRQRLNALPDGIKEQAEEVVIICHHGIRSALVTAWLREQGWQNVYSMEGGLAAYARDIDSSIGTY
ncbi:MAG: rhodanese [Calditrichaeota bacterium]|nr:rhodanese [Calditrichota bacterium]